MRRRRTIETEEEAAAVGQASVTIDIVFAFTPQLHHPQQLFHTVNIQQSSIEAAVSLSLAR